MSISFVLGNLLGRALLGYGIVWLVYWLACRFDWCAAWRRSLRWYNGLVVAVLTLLGMGGALVRQGVAS